MPRLVHLLWSKIKRRPLVTVSAVILLFWLVIVWFCPRDEGLGAILYRQSKRNLLLESTSKRFSFVCEVKSVKKKANGQWVRAQKDDTFVEGYVPVDVEVLVGDSLKIYAQLSLPEPASNPGQFDAQVYYALRKTDYLMTVYSCEVVGHRQTLFSLLEEWRTTLSDNLFAILPEEEAGVCSAIVLGTSDLVDSETKELFQGAGIAHLLAVSGLHVMSFFSAVSLAFTKALGTKNGALCSIAFMWLYVLFTGYSVSAIRAGLMMSFKVAARLFYRRDDPLVSYLVSAVIIVCVQPLYLLDAGFWLSFGAMLGIRFLNPILQNISYIPYILRKVFSSSLSVLVFTTPISLYFYFEFNPYSIFINPIVIPFMTYVYALSSIGAFVCFISPVLGRFAVGFVYFIIKAYIGASKWLNSLPGAKLLIGRPEWWQMLGYYTLVFLGMLFFYQKPESRKRFWYCWVSAGTLCFLALFPYRQDQIVFLNVGQGDCAVIEVHNKVYLVDAGPNYSQVIKPYLESRGICRIDGVFLSHPDADHMAGVASILLDEDFEVSALYIGNTKYTEKEEYNAVLSGAQQVVKLNAGQRVLCDGLSFTCLSPKEGRLYENDNDASMVLLFESDSFAVYFMGDIEESGERSVVSRLHEVTTPTYIKIAHHGSKTSTSAELLDAIEADAAIISAKKSVYGHPHEETLSRLQERGILWYITEYTGAIWLTRKGLKCYN